MTIESLSKEVRRLRLMTITLGLTFAVLIGTAATSDRTSFTEIDVERINVREPDGRYALIIGNAERLPGGIVGGEEVMARRHAPGILFFNHKGDECGGLIFRTDVLEDGRGVGYGHLSFDQYGQNQVVALQYMQNWRTMRNGLRVIDRPRDMTMAEVIEL